MCRRHKKCSPPLCLDPSLLLREEKGDCLWVDATMATRTVLQQHIGVAINLHTALAGGPSHSASSSGSPHSTIGLHKAQCLGISNLMKTSVFGDAKQLSSGIVVPSAPARGRKPVITMVKPTLQFIKGVDELSVPEVKMTISRDGDNGTATFIFDQPSVFESSLELGDITGLYMIDEEGVMQTVEVSAKFLNGKPSKIEARYVMRNRKEWDRFLRFMERYSDANSLQFVKK